jgi:hypothetical protein
MRPFVSLDLPGLNGDAPAPELRVISGLLGIIEEVLNVLSRTLAYPLNLSKTTSLLDHPLQIIPKCVEAKQVVVR